MVTSYVWSSWSLTYDEHCMYRRSNISPTPLKRHYSFDLLAFPIFYVKKSTFIDHMIHFWSENYWYWEKHLSLKMPNSNISPLLHLKIYGICHTIVQKNCVQLIRICGSSKSRNNYSLNCLWIHWARTTLNEFSVPSKHVTVIINVRWKLKLKTQFR